MGRFGVTFLAVFLAGTLGAWSASAEDIVARASADQVSHCGPRSQVIDELSTIYHEAPSAIGQINQGLVIEVYRSARGNFTIISTDTSGNSCVVAVGENWQDTVTLAGAES